MFTDILKKASELVGYIFPTAQFTTIIKCFYIFVVCSEKMSKRDIWNLEDPKQAEEALEYFYSLPEDEINSENEADSDAEEQLNALEKKLTKNINIYTSSPVSPSTTYNLYSNSPVTADYDPDEVLKENQQLDLRTKEHFSPNIRQLDNEPGETGLTTIF